VRESQVGLATTELLLKLLVEIANSELDLDVGRQVAAVEVAFIELGQVTSKTLLGAAMRSLRPERGSSTRRTCSRGATAKLSNPR
jgi:hypothetical protein